MVSASSAKARSDGSDASPLLVGSASWIVRSRVWACTTVANKGLKPPVLVSPAGVLNHCVRDPVVVEKLLHAGLFFGIAEPLGQRWFSSGALRKTERARHQGQWGLQFMAHGTDELTLLAP